MLSPARDWLSGFGRYADPPFPGGFLLSGSGAPRPASYSAQLVTRCRCFGMWRRHAALALNGTAGVRVSGKGSPSYITQLSTPTGRSMQQGVLATLKV